MNDSGIDIAKMSKRMRDLRRETALSWAECAIAALNDAGKVIVSAEDFKVLLRLVDAEWMVTPDWCTPGGRAPIIEPAYEVLEKHKAMIEGSGE